MLPPLPIMSQEKASTTPPRREIPQEPVTMPQAPALEKSLICMMALDPTNIISHCISDGINEEFFYIPAHRILWNIFRDRYERNLPIDIASVAQTLTDEGKLEAIGGNAGLADIFSVAGSTALFEAHFATIKEKYLRRCMIMAGNKMHELALSAETEIDQLLDSAEQEVMDIRKSSLTSTQWSLKKDIQTAMSNMEKMMDHRGTVLGLTTGYPLLDRMINGLKPGELFVIAARPSMGKTSFLLNIMEHLALEEKKPVLIFSCEMPSVQLVERLLYARSGVSRSDLVKGDLTQAHFKRINKAINEYQNSSLVIDDTAAISISELRAKARRIIKERPDTAAIGVDYLQLMRSHTKQAQNSREREIAEISAGLKGLAKELSVPIIVLAQLNRGPESRTGKAKGLPMMSDLRESGAIEQDADMIGLLYRAAYYAGDDEEREKVGTDANLMLAKNRNGPTGDIPLSFEAELMRFSPRVGENQEEG